MHNCCKENLIDVFSYSPLKGYFGTLNLSKKEFDILKNPKSEKAMVIVQIEMLFANLTYKSSRLLQISMRGASGGHHAASATY